MPAVDLADAFFDRYRSLRVRLAPFRLKEDRETVKTVRMIEAMINRAETLHAGARPESRFGVTAGHTVSHYLTRAEELLEGLERGEFPLAGLLAEPGMALVDHSFLVAGDEVHLFFNREDVGYEWDTRFGDTLGHAVSRNMTDWRFVSPCLAVQGDVYEDYQIWSPGVTEWNGRYYMAYTAVNRAVAQSVRLAVSDDLFHWERLSDTPQILPGPWGKWDLQEWSDCRDPQLFTDEDGVIYCYYCTRRFDQGDPEGVPALGIASSGDMLRWTDRGAYRLELSGSAVESPFVMKKGELYYLFYTACGIGTAYAVSENPVTGWRDRGVLFEKRRPALCDANVPSCAEVVCFRGKWYISCCERLPGFEQYLELYRLNWKPDGGVEIGERVHLKEI